MKKWHRSFESDYGDILAIVVENELTFMMMVEGEMQVFSENFKSEDVAIGTLACIDNDDIARFIEVKIEPLVVTVH